MTNHAEQTRPRRSAGRTAGSLIALVAVVAGIPALLIACSRLGLDAAHPFPAIGSRDEIGDYVERGLTSTEVTSIVLRGSLIVGWVLWAAMVSSVLGAIVESSRGRSVSIPQFRIFGGMGRWIATGLMAATAVVPTLSTAGLAGAGAPPLPATSTFVRAIAHPEMHASAAQSAPSIVAPSSSSRSGFETVRPGESPQTFAQRVLGDGSRWRELFELNQGRAVGPDGESWTESWRLLSGWELQLPPDAVVTQFTAPDGLLAGAATSTAKSPALGAITESAGERAAPTQATVGEHVVVGDDSYWSIAETQLGVAASGSQVYEQTQALMDYNAPRLGHSDPAMLQPGDVVMLVAPSSVLVDAAAAEQTAIASGAPYHTVVEGDSYWAIATDRVIELYGVDGAYASRVFELSEDLQDLNWPRLGYEERPMLHPGVVVFLEDPAPYLVPELPPPSAGTAVFAPVLDFDSSEMGGVVAGIAVAEVVEVDEPVEPAIVMEADVDDPVIDADIAHDDDGQGWVSTTSVLGLSALATAGAAGLFAARRRRASRGRPHQRPAPLPEHLAAAAAALSYADGSHVNWLALELRWLVHHCAPALRTSLMVEEIQVGHDRDVEIAFAATPLSEPPAGWTMVAERIWQLDRPHTAEELAEWADMPPLLPCLVTLGRFAGGELYCNVEQHPGISAAGDPALVDEWVTSVVWEVAAGAVSEHPTVLLVDTVVPGSATLEGVHTMLTSHALEHFADVEAPPAGEGLLDLRTNAYEGWDTTLVVLGRDVDPAEWETIAALPHVGVITLGAGLSRGLDIVVADGTVSIDRWNLVVETVGVSTAEADLAAEVLDAADAVPVPDELVIPVVTTETPRPDSTMWGPENTAAPLDEDDVDDFDHDVVVDDEPDIAETDAASDTVPGWSPPTWKVTVRLLSGAPGVESADGRQIRLNPQPLAALAFIALHRQASLDDLRTAIWGDEPVKPHRVRDLLSELRKRAGGTRVLSHITDGVVSAGVDLGCDVTVFEAHVARANDEPSEAGEHLTAMAALGGGGLPFGYPSSASNYWRWVDVAHLQAVWGHRLATACYELAELHLSHGDPNTALGVAERGLQSDPLNAGLTEMVMTCFNELGAADSARRVYESHVRLLEHYELGDASEETRRVLDNMMADRARVAAAVDNDSAAEAG